MVPSICCIGHITVDSIITPQGTVTMPGGTAFYFSKAIAHMPVSYLLVTALAPADMGVVQDLRSSGLAVQVLPSSSTVHFENRYGENQDQRTQRVLQKAAPFTAAEFGDITAGIFHLGPLLADDFSAADIKALATKGQLSLDVQGFLRRVENQQVLATDWEAKLEVLPLLHFLKASEEEMSVLTGTKDVRTGAKRLADWGVKEVVITLGSRGSVVYAEGRFYAIPAYQPRRVQDATGCGDTYMAGYLFQRSKGEGIQQAGEFAAAMATLKIGGSGPFTGTQEEVNTVVTENIISENAQAFLLPDIAQAALDT